MQFERDLLQRVRQDGGGQGRHKRKTIAWPT
jgi:hypothetical protein